MKVTKEMVHEDLRPDFAKWSFVTYLVRFKWMAHLVNYFTNKKFKGQNIEGLQCEETYIPSSDGEYKIRVRIYRPEWQKGDLPAILYTHGGGYITGNPEQFNPLLERFVKTRPCVIIAPDYRKAYTQPFPAGFNDCYDTLLWAKVNAKELSITNQFIIAGHSAGGGLTAAVTLKARDTKDVDIAFQMPIYPMIDDQQPVDPNRYVKAPLWDTVANRTGWNAYLKDFHKKGIEITAYAAPARNTDYSDFPPTITFVGTVEPFYKETLAYVDALRKANIDVLLKEYKGAYHGFDTAMPDTNIAKDALHFTFDGFGLFYDKYIKAAERGKSV